MNVEGGWAHLFFFLYTISILSLSSLFPFIPLLFSFTFSHSFPPFISCTSKLFFLLCCLLLPSLPPCLFFFSPTLKSLLPINFLPFHSYFIIFCLLFHISSPSILLALPPWPFLSFSHLSPSLSLPLHICCVSLFLYF